MELTLNLTHACNMGCSYCNAGAKSARVMSFETGREAIRLALAEAPREPLHVAFFGGEPLLEKRLLLRLADEARWQARTRGVPCRLAVTTNGTLLDEATADALAVRGVQLGLSFDGGGQDATRSYAGGRSTTEAVLRALDLALARFERVTVISVIDPANVRGLADSVADFVARGVRRITLNPNWLTAWGDEEREVWEAAYAANARLWAQAHRLSAPFVINTIDPKIWRRLTEQADGAGCGFGEREWAVAPSGRIYPCGRIVGEDPDEPRDPRRAHCLGDVVGGLDPAAQACLPRPGGGALPSECQVCAYRSRCASRCGCANAEAGGDPATPSGLLCWHETMSIGLADAVAAELYAERDPSFMARFYLETPALTPA